MQEQVEQGDGAEDRKQNLQYVKELKLQYNMRKDINISKKKDAQRRVNETPGLYGQQCRLQQGMSMHRTAYMTGEQKQNWHIQKQNEQCK
jgi:hypothetical protein